jgi:hypothetical protein
MLRITTNDNPRTLTFRLEGKLSGPWVRELEECWRRALAGQSGPILAIDLTEVTSIDAAGRACLEAMHRQGAEFVAADCLMKAVVAEIIGDKPGDGPEPDRGHPLPGAETGDDPAQVRPPPTARLRGRPDR